MLREVAILEPTTVILLVLAAVVIMSGASLGGMVLQRRLTTRRMGDIAEHGRRVLEEAERSAETRLKDAAIEAKEVVYRARADLVARVDELAKRLGAVLDEGRPRT